METFEPYVGEIDKLIRRVSFVIKCRGRDILNEFDITTPQFNALLLLKEHGDMTIGDLGAKMYLASSTATDLIDRMERNGLVVRVRDSNDRRVVRLHMLEKGHQMIKEVLTNRKRYLSTILSQVPEAELEALKKALQSLYELMKPEVAKE
ncbi:MAG: MarR family winged helix-turn-helix transcriptional regulator [Bacillota bacterium]|jgi:DNA-binding MarR family transcriptional regulator